MITLTSGSGWQPRSVLAWTFLMLGLLSANLVPAGEPPSVEGVWRVTSANYPENDGGYTIVREARGYNVIPANPTRGGKPYQGVGLYQGSPTEILAVQTPSVQDLLEIAAGSNIPASVFRQLAGKLSLRHRFTLSRDGNTLELARDFFTVTHDTGTGRLISYQIMPYADRAMLARVPGPPAAAPPPASAPVAQAAPVAGPTPVYAAVVARGDFYILTKDGRKLTGKDAERVQCEAGSRVMTGSNARVQLVLPDETVFTIGANSEVEVDSFVYHTPSSAKEIAVSVTKGVFRWVTGKVAPPKLYPPNQPPDMKVNLPGVMGGIRGTDFEATVNPDKSGMLTLHFGQLEITEKKTGFTFFLEAGYKITFDAEGTVGRPMRAE